MNIVKEVYAMGVQPGSEGGSGTTSPFTLMFPWIMIFAIFYLLVFRPQRQKQKRLEKTIAELEKGDKIVTSGGLIGIVAGLKEKSVTVRISENVKVEILRSSVSHVEKTKQGKEESER